MIKDILALPAGTWQANYADKNCRRKKKCSHINLFLLGLKDKHVQAAQTISSTQ